MNPNTWVLIYIIVNGIMWLSLNESCSSYLCVCAYLILRLEALGPSPLGRNLHGWQILVWRLVWGEFVEHISCCLSHACERDSSVGIIARQCSAGIIATKYGSQHIMHHLCFVIAFSCDILPQLEAILSILTW